MKKTVIISIIILVVASVIFVVIYFSFNSPDSLPDEPKAKGDEYKNTVSIEEISSFVSSECQKGEINSSWKTGFESSNRLQQFRRGLALVQQECENCEIYYDSGTDKYYSPPYEYIVDNNQLIKNFGKRVTWPGYSYLFTAQDFDFEDLINGTVKTVSSIDGNTQLIVDEQKSYVHQGDEEKVYSWYGAIQEKIVNSDGSIQNIAVSFRSGSKQGEWKYLARREDDKIEVYKWQYLEITKFNTKFSSVETNLYLEDRKGLLSNLYYREKIENQLYDLYIRMQRLSPDDLVTEVYQEVLEDGKYVLDRINGIVYVAPDAFYKKLDIVRGSNAYYLDRYAFEGAEFLGKYCEWDAYHKCQLPENSIIAKEYLDLVSQVCL